jgi:hypothetical protein
LFLCYTIFRTPAFDHTEPEGSPADEVGIFFIERLFTNVAHTLSAVMLLPTIIAQAHPEVVLSFPPKIELNAPLDVLLHPPTTIL